MHEAITQKDNIAPEFRGVTTDVAGMRSLLVQHKEAAVSGLGGADILESNEPAEHTGFDMNDDLFSAIGETGLVGVAEQYSPLDEVDELISSAFGGIELESGDDSPLAPFTLAVGGITPGNLRLQTYVKNSDRLSRSRTLISVTYAEVEGKILTTIGVTVSGKVSEGDDGKIGLADVFPDSHQDVSNKIKTDVLRQATDRLWGAVIPALNKEKDFLGE